MCFGIHEGFRNSTAALRRPGDLSFEVWLASTLLSRIHDFERRGWVPITARATIVPFAYVVVTAMIVAWWLQHVCPAAATLRAALTCWLGAR